VVYLTFTVQGIKKKPYLVLKLRGVPGTKIEQICLTGEIMSCFIVTHILQQFQETNIYSLSCLPCKEEILSFNYDNLEKKRYKVKQFQRIIQPIRENKSVRK